MEKSVGSRIKELRKKRGWTQEDLGKRVNVSPQVISNWERGYSIPDSMDIQTTSKVLNTSTDYLLGRSDDPTLKKDSQDIASLPEVQFIMRAKEEMSPKAYAKFLKLVEQAKKAFDEDED
ncbi:helix-turn-helix transcriptional regulator [Cohnella cholangitidis]|uniref:Helix-turn-helix transcriptional regulator n=2 Tax=Cohnella cholangitidis TaxID=2598458 RepID=A0A7G5C7F4_9BACL|nr:helix-turn-helix transcriptional regulator [Cohnella cholangitidis]